MPAQSKSVEISADGRTYRPSLQARLGLIACGALILCFVITLAWLGPGWLNPKAGLGLSLFLTAFELTFGALALYTAVVTAKMATVLYPDRIERRDLFRSRSMSRADLRGYTTQAPRNSFPMMKLFAKEGLGKALTIMVFCPDPAFHHWFEGVADLDALERKTARKALFADPAFGSTPKARRANIRRARIFGRWANGIGAGALIWAFMWPHPYSAAVIASGLCMIVGVGLVAAMRGQLALFDEKGSARTDVGLLLFGSLGLTLRALLDVAIFSWSEVVAPVAALTAAMAALAFAADRRLFRNAGVPIATVILVTAWSYGVVVEADSLLDRSRATIFPVQVLDKSESHGRTTSYTFNLPPWGPRTEAENTEVNGALYRQTTVGSTVCIYLYPGALHIRWFDVDRC
jgi:hypothetical protein